MSDIDQYKSARLGALNPAGRLPLGFRELVHELLAPAELRFSRQEALRRASSSLLRFSGTDMACIRVDEDERTIRCRVDLNPDGTESVRMHLPQDSVVPGECDPAACDPIREPILQAILTGGFSSQTQSYTRGRSFWTADSARPIMLRGLGEGAEIGRSVVIGGDFPSLAIIPFPVTDRAQGILFLASRRRDFFVKENVQLYEAATETLGVALAHQAAQWALKERIKELTCLYGIEKLASRPRIQLDEILTEIVGLLPPGWQYPEITAARIVLDNRTFATPGFRDSTFRQSARILVNDNPRGTVEVEYLEEMPLIDEGPFLKEERSLINAVADTIGRLAAHYEAEWALRERVKELTCLYGIANVAGRSAAAIEDVLREIVGLLPPGWQYPEITQARILVDDCAFSTEGFRVTPFLQAADVTVGDVRRGSVEVVYTERRPDAYEGPFLREERSLIDEIARRIGFIVEHWEAEQQTARLQEQLRHAERLATVGQLAAGVAHELNEPLATVLGFAEITKDVGGIPPQAMEDIRRIFNAALHAREVIRKLMIFTRQMPTKQVRCNLNHLVTEGLYFLESRCAKEDIKLVRRLQQDLPDVWADPSQLHQVLVNLVVNAIQAMPRGGTLTLTTHSDAVTVCMLVQDTGVGMTPEVHRQLFMPFFTTKQIGEGTGLGLAVVHGIVTAHKGKVNVESEVGRGSSFEVCIPIQGPSKPEEGS